MAEEKKTELAGWTAVASSLKVAGYGDVSRQAVYGWWRRRDNTGFPEGTHVTEGKKTSRGTLKFKLSEVLDWRRDYVPNKGGRPKK